MVVASDLSDLSLTRFYGHVRECVYYFVRTKGFQSYHKGLLLTAT